MRRAHRGFTLVETLVAVTVLALMFGALLPVFQQGLTMLRVGDERSRAVMLAESLLAAAASTTGDGAALDRDQGEENGFTWAVSREPHDVDELGTVAEDAPLRLVRVRVDVSWGDDASSRLSLATLGVEARR